MHNENAPHEFAAQSQQPIAPKGPSLDQQLRESKVIPGTALESLVKENQDFTLLDPVEFSDNQPFPLWLRVYARKTHPEIEFTPGKPAYPLVLKQLLEYMIKHQDAPIGASPAPAPQPVSTK